jgi:hypothetical protein
MVAAKDGIGFLPGKTLTKKPGAVFPIGERLPQIEFAFSAKVYDPGKIRKVFFFFF